MSNNKRNSKYRHPRYYVIGLEDNPVAPLLTHSLTAQPFEINTQNIEITILIGAYVFILVYFLFEIIKFIYTLNYTIIDSIFQQQKNKKILVLSSMPFY
jgi:hypothetical protein